VDDLHDTSVYADKTYVSKALKQLLEEQGTSLNTPAKKEKGKIINMADEILSSSVSRIRQPIESLFSWIDEKTGIQTASKVRSTQGLLVHVYGKLAADSYFQLLIRIDRTHLKINRSKMTEQASCRKAKKLSA
jgi:hypothetical protein